MFAVPVDAFSATVLVSQADHFRIAPSPTEDDTFGTLADLRSHVEHHGVTGSRELLLATIHRLVDHTGLDLTPCSIGVRTGIPRSVGLAGSSAIVIAAIRALLAFHGAPTLDPDELSALALSVETDVLGIRAGLQDRVVQASGEPVLMRFGPEHRRDVHGFTVGTYETIHPASKIELMIAALPASAESSDLPHAGLHERHLAGDPALRRATASLAASALDAAAAWEAGDALGLGRAMDDTFDIRCEMMELRTDHRTMVDAARRAGGHANFAGSGGSVSVVSSDPSKRRGIRDALESLGCVVISCEFGGGGGG